ncbi:MAG: hypothetical protein HYS09_09885 [Chloroflexi bacterium]|nr:hypothetical protein [Chloroflexota bacterium]
MPKPARPRFFSYDGPPQPGLLEAAEGVLRRRLADYGAGLETATAGHEGLYVLLSPDGRTALLRLLANAAPHRRSGNNLGLHWMLRSDIEEYVALVDVSRESVWLLPAADFRARAQPLPGGRFHLDWLALRLSARSRVADEDQFEQYRLENVMEGEGLASAHPEPVEGVSGECRM